MIKKLTKTVIVAIATVAITGQTTNAQESIFLTSPNGTEICPNEEGKGELTFKIAITDEWDNYEYRFQEGTNAEFGSVTTNEEFTTNTLNKKVEPGTHYYRVKAIPINDGSNIISDVLIITVYEPLQTGQYTDDTQTMNVGTAELTTTTAVGSGNGELQYQWYRADDANGEYTEIEGATRADYTTPTMNITSYFKRSVFDGCTAKGEAFTKNSEDEDFMEVKIQLNPGEIEWKEETDNLGELVICEGTNIKSAIKSSTKATGASGSYTYTWQLLKEGNIIASYESQKDSLTIEEITEKFPTENSEKYGQGLYWIRRHVGDNKDGEHNNDFSNEIPLLIANDAHEKHILLMKNEPVESGDNVLLAYIGEVQDNKCDIQWIINDTEKDLSSRNLYRIDKTFEGKFTAVLKTTTKQSGCYFADTIKFDVTKRKVDTVTITNTVEVEVEKIVEVPVEKIVEKEVEKIVEVPVEKIVEVEKIVYRDTTIYVEKTPDNKTAITTKNINLNIWPNPATTFVNAEAEESFSYMLLNNAGIILKKEEGNLSYTINMSEYSDGVYFIKTSDGVTHKIVKE